MFRQLNKKKEALIVKAREVLAEQDKILEVTTPAKVEVSVRSAYTGKPVKFTADLLSHADLTARYEASFQSIPTRQLPVRHIPLATIEATMQMQMLLAVYMMASLSPIHAEAELVKSGVENLKKDCLDIESQTVFPTGFVSSGQSPDMTTEEFITFLMNGMRGVLSVADAFSNVKDLHLSVNGFVPGEHSLPTPMLFALSPTANQDFENMAVPKKNKDFYNFFKHFSAYDFSHRNKSLKIFDKSNMPYELKALAESWIEQKLKSVPKSEYSNSDALRTAMPSYPVELLRKFLFKVHSPSDKNSRYVFGCDLFFDYCMSTGIMKEKASDTEKPRDAWATSRASDLFVRNVCLLDPPEDRKRMKLASYAHITKKAFFLGKPVGTLKVSVYYSDDNRLTVSVHPVYLQGNNPQLSVGTNSYFCTDSHSLYDLSDVMNKEGSTRSILMDSELGQMLPLTTMLGIDKGKVKYEEESDRWGAPNAARNQKYSNKKKYGKSGAGWHAKQQFTAGANPHADFIKVRLSKFEEFFKSFYSPTDTKHFSKDYLSELLTHAHAYSSADMKGDTDERFIAMFALLLGGAKRFDTETSFTDLSDVSAKAFDTIFVKSYIGKDSFLHRWLGSISAVSGYLKTMYSTMIPPTFKGLLETDEFPTATEFDIVPTEAGKDIKFSKNRGYNSSYIDISDDKAGYQTVSAATALVVEPVQKELFTSPGKAFITETRIFFSRKLGAKVNGTYNIDNEFTSD